jgi:hypothetical protein
MALRLKILQKFSSDLLREHVLFLVLGNNLTFQKGKVKETVNRLKRNQIWKPDN